jgi:asparagine synthase (glutamine-hydrolysing)
MNPWVRTLLSGAMRLVNPDLIPFTKKAYNFSTRYKKIQLILQKGNPVHAMKVISQFNTAAELKDRFLFPFDLPKTDFDINGELNDFNDNLNKMLAVDYRTFLVDNNLTKVDRATMSVSLEGREPLLDHRIIEFSAQLPSHYKFENGKGKIILKNIVHKYVPENIMNRPKMGFIVPIMGWFRNELKDMVMHHLNDERLRQDGIFNMREVAGLRDRYLKGHSENVQKLWHLLIFQMWKERWMFH